MPTKRVYELPSKSNNTRHVNALKISGPLCTTNALYEFEISKFIFIHAIQPLLTLF